MTTKQPHEHDKKKILVAVTGLTPQVVTETLYCLTVQRKLRGEPMFIPTEIHLLTTGAGKKEIDKHLIEGKSWLRQIVKDYPEILGADQDVFIKATKQLLVLDADDVRTSDQSGAAADGIVNALRELIAADKNNESAIVASIAGGRASMGYLLGNALSVFGRDQDRLKHVLVKEEGLEDDEEFFYPRPRDKITHKSSRHAASGPDSLVLSDIPFFPLRNVLDDDFLQHLLGKERRYLEIVQLIRDATEPRLTIQNNDPTITCGGVRVTLEPMEFAVYYYAAVKYVEGAPLDLVALSRQEAATPGHVADTLLSFYPETTNAAPRAKRREEIVDAAGNGDYSQFFLSKLSRVRGKILDAFAGIEPLAKAYFDSPLGKKMKGAQQGEKLRPRGLNLPPDAVEIQSRFIERA